MQNEAEVVSTSILGHLGRGECGVEVVMRQGEQDGEGEGTRENRSAVARKGQFITPTRFTTPLSSDPGARSFSSYPFPFSGREDGNKRKRTHMGLLMTVFTQNST